jgi:hypothetical protein
MASRAESQSPNKMARPPQSTYDVSTHDPFSSFSTSGVGSDNRDIFHSTTIDIPRNVQNPPFRRKPVGSQTSERKAYSEYTFTPLNSANIALSKPPRGHSAATKKIYWVTPATAIALFLVGLGSCIGHHLFLKNLNDKVVENQVWINRYSLALAFLVKASLAAAISVAFSQKLWYSLNRTSGGVSVTAIDALFTVLESPLQFSALDMWSSAPIATAMALAIWLIPLSALISPTALTVGLVVQNSTNKDCLVPTLNMNNQTANILTNSLSLSTVDHTGNVFTSSMEAQRLVGLTAQNGRQSGWSSPCGPNCSYEVEFMAPSWKCYKTQELDNPDVPWRNWNLVDRPDPAMSYWFYGYGNGSNITLESDAGNIEYGPIYGAGLNDNTNQFWVGISGQPGLPTEDIETVQKFLEMHIFYCDFMNSSYRLQINYVNDHQVNNILSLTMLDRISPPSWAWSLPRGQCEELVCVDRASLDTISLYRALIQIIQGSINRSPEGESLSDNTTVALVPTLVGYDEEKIFYGEAEPAIPYTNMGPLLEELSHNISISLLSEPRLQITGITTTTCTISRTLTVWKYKYMPLVVAYASAVGATMIALGVGGHALVSSGVARDKSFSSIVRTTRSRELDELSPGSELAGLPLVDEIGKMKLRFRELSPDVCKNPGDNVGSRLGFQLVEEIEMR